MSTSADSTGRSAFPSANAERAPARRRGVGKSDPRVGMSRRCSSRSPSVAEERRGRPVPGDGRVGNDGGRMMHDRVLHMAGARPAAFLSFFRHARTCSGHPRSAAAPLAPAHRTMPQDVDARNKSIAVRFRWGGPGARRWYRRVSGPSAGSGHGSRPAHTRRPFPPGCHPGLDPGSREARRGRCLWAWTPDQVRGDNRGAETASLMGPEPALKS